MLRKIAIALLAAGVMSGTAFAQANLPSTSTAPSAAIVSHASAPVKTVRHVAPVKHAKAAVRGHRHVHHVRHLRAPRTAAKAGVSKRLPAHAAHVSGLRQGAPRTTATR